MRIFLTEVYLWLMFPIYLWAYVARDLLSFSIALLFIAAQVLTFALDVRRRRSALTIWDWFSGAMVTLAIPIGIISIFYAEVWGLVVAGALLGLSSFLSWVNRLKTEN